MRGLARAGRGVVPALDRTTVGFKAYEIAINVPGVEIFGFRFGASPQDIARAVAKEVAVRLGRQGRGR